MSPRRATLICDLDLETARRRLMAAIDSPFDPRGRRPVRGRVGPFTAALYQRRRMHNAFQTRMGLVLEPRDEAEGRGLILHAVSDIGAVGRGLLIGMSALLIGLAVAMRHELGEGSPLPLLAALVGAFGLGLVYAVGRAVAAGEHDFLVRFLIQTLDAREVETPREP
ncbi:MAG: hypothetical protein KF910_05635 [Brevundimonas sp.]|uniref:hypothetical protein n=1 Tax=Brevundimonas sp. TaxID=1871086 RepID=UPI0025BD4499|nr:hypothetical protein [Brevundimonas sp.]MBX3477066.1 hypothetical protein [Brevundimonas sp.]